MGPTHDPAAEPRTRSASTSAKTARRRHSAKAGTPTMGGALILVAIVVATLLWADLAQPLRLDRAAGHAGVRRDRLGWTTTRS
ncbi:MAG: hypothetical protein MZV65_19875 [Chromatiales bacterium]|nr:hypothetical protein [Chromatiales bacterium]